MKKIVRYFAVMSAVIMLICSFATSVFAKDLEPCYHCNGKGEYHCSVCNNKGEFVCKACGGARKTVCPGADGEGKATTDGMYVHPATVTGNAARATEKLQKAYAVTAPIPASSVIFVASSVTEPERWTATIATGQENAVVR